MSDTIGVPIDHFIQAVIDSYEKGFSDAIECLKGAKDTINTEEMKKSIREEMRKQGKIKAEW